MIAKGFANYFSGNFVNSSDNVPIRNLFESAYDAYASNVNNQCYTPFSIMDVKIAVAKLKKGKSPGSDNISPEHILYAGDTFVNALTDLFNMCIVHGFVPDSFSFAVIVLVVKDKNGDVGKFSNYMPISLVMMFSKVLELCFMDRLTPLLQVEELQFGFVPNKGCQKALFTLETVVNYFTCRGSPVFMASLDVTKAFDRVNHFALFHKLIDVGVPLYILNVLINWHCKLAGCVRWLGSMSDMFAIKSGVREGGIISPWFFNLYVNNLITRLKNSGLGCHLCSEFVGCLFFADDILLLSGSMLQLQSMLNICVEYGEEFDLKFNALKSFLIQIGLVDHHDLPDLELGDRFLKWVECIKYLGVWIIEGKFFKVDCNMNIELNS
jgi:hypothetical protein